MLKKSLPAIFVIAAIAGASAVDSTTDSLNGLRPGCWGIGLRTLGESTSLLAFRTLTPNWAGMARVSWSTSNSGHDSPDGLTTTTTGTTTTSSSSDSVINTHNHSLFLVLTPQYDLPMKHGLDFTGGIGLYGSWAWSTTDQSSTTSANAYSSGYSKSWTLNGGLNAIAGLRWWIIPQTFAVAGEMEARAWVGFTRASGNSTTTPAGSSTTTTTSYKSGTWNYSSSTYVCFLGLDGFF